MNLLGGLAKLDSIGIRGLRFDSEEGYEAMYVGPSEQIGRSSVAPPVSA